MSRNHELPPKVTAGDGRRADEDGFVEVVKRGRGRPPGSSSRPKLPPPEIPDQAPSTSTRSKNPHARDERASGEGDRIVGEKAMRVRVNLHLRRNFALYLVSCGSLFCYSYYGQLHDILFVFTRSVLYFTCCSCIATHCMIHPSSSPIWCSVKQIEVALSMG